jgi:hypothetical protein
MPDPITGLIAGGATLIGGSMQAEAAGEAAGIQGAAAMAGVEEQRRQFDRLQELMRPYVEAGLPAMQAQRAMLGLTTPEEQAAQIRAVQESPMFQELTRQGEEALLTRASATGGLRGGDIQGALAQFRPQMLAQQLEDRYSKLGGFTALGQQSAAGVGTAGMETGRGIAGLLGQQGAAMAGAEIAKAQAYAPLFNLPMQLAGMHYGSKSMGGKGIF